MKRTRYMKLSYAGGELTKEEICDGWHFCPDWDDLLISKAMPEIDGCTCDLVAYENKHGCNSQKDK